MARAPVETKEMTRARLLWLLALAACGAATDEGERGGGATTAMPPIGAALESFDLRDANGAELAWSARLGLRHGSASPGVPAALMIHVFQPDCPACRDEGRALERMRSGSSAVTVVGIAHRGGPDEVRAFAAATGATYPLAPAAGTPWAERWSRGDPTYVVDRTGDVAYGQVGFHPADPETWADVIADLTAGRPARVTGPRRDVLAVGMRMPAVELPVLGEEGAARITTSEAGALTIELDGETRACTAALWFFSRY